MSRTFIVYWCSEGLEAVIDITESMEKANTFEKEKIFEILKDPDHDPRNVELARINNMVHHMMLRGQFNTQRHYELYALHTTDEIDRADLEDMFNDNPQDTVNLIRERGTHIWGSGICKNVPQIV